MLWSLCADRLFHPLRIRDGRWAVLEKLLTGLLSLSSIVNNSPREEEKHSGQNIKCLEGVRKMIEEKGRNTAMGEELVLLREVGIHSYSFI